MVDRLVILLGPPASGKGTQAFGIAARFGWRTFSSGAAIRSHVRRGTAFGRKYEAMLASAYLLPDETILELIQDELKDHGGGLVLDGFPRTIPQAEMFGVYCLSRGWKIDAALAIVASREELAPRVLARVTCAECGGTFNGTMDRVVPGDPCPYCQGMLMRRLDDTPGLFDERFTEYEKLTRPVIAYYEKLGLMHSFSAMSPPMELASQIEALLISLP
jgi:adenylate kinase